MTADTPTPSGTPRTTDVPRSLAKYEAMKGSAPEAALQGMFEFAIDLERENTALRSHAPAGALPEGCPVTAFFDPMDGQIHSDEKSGEEVTVEIHPVGTRALLSRPAPQGEPVAWVPEYLAADFGKVVGYGSFAFTKKDGFTIALYAAPVQAVALTEGERGAIIMGMVDRFLGWKLPEDFNPDGGIVFEGSATGPIGTNLFTADQAEAMIRYLLEGPPLRRLSAPVASEGWQPMSTAPRDGKKFLGRHGDSISVAWYSSAWGKFVATGGITVELTAWTPLIIPKVTA